MSVEDKSGSKTISDKAINEGSEDERTIFVGNLSVEIDEKTLKRSFRKFGKVESVRFRGSIPSNPKLSKKVAANKKQLHEKQKSRLGYVVFAEKSSAEKSLTLNGTKLGTCHIRVDLANRKESTQHPSVFVGNLAYDVSDEALYSFFAQCGDLIGARVIRDRLTGMGKGFGYINFQSNDGVQLALRLDGAELEKRPIRVQKIKNNATKKHNIIEKKKGKSIDKKKSKKDKFEKYDTDKNTKLSGKKRKQQKTNIIFEGNNPHKIMAKKKKGKLTKKRRPKTNNA